MGVRILHGDRRVSPEGAILYCSTSGWAFGPYFDVAEDAEEFLEWFTSGAAFAAALAAGGFDNRAPLAAHELTVAATLDPRSYTQDALKRLYALWVDEREPAVSEPSGL